MKEGQLVFGGLLFYFTGVGIIISIFGIIFVKESIGFCIWLCILILWIGSCLRISKPCKDR